VGVFVGGFPSQTRPVKQPQRFAQKKIPSKEKRQKGEKEGPGVSCEPSRGGGENRLKG